MPSLQPRLRSLSSPRRPLERLPGLPLRPSSVRLVLGALTEDALSNLRVDKLFIGSSAIDVNHGLSADDPAEVQTDRALMAVAAEIIILADHTKFDRKRTMRVVPMQRVSLLITDRGITDDQRQALGEAGVAVEVV